MRRSSLLYGAGLAGTALLALTACGGSSSGSSGPSGQAVSSIGANQYSTGTATKDVDAVTWYGDYRPIYSLDPLKLADYPEETILPNVCEPLIRTGQNYALSPGLASSYTFSSDSKTLTVKIRAGVKFTDGATMTSDDVAYSLNRNLDPKVASNYAGSYEHVKSIKATDASTVVMTFSQPEPTFTGTLGTLAGAIVEKKFAVAKAQAFGSANTGVVCTGPYKLVSYDGTSKLVLTRNDSYWDTANKPHVKTLTFVFPSDSSALVNGLKAGTIDGGFDIPSNVLTQLQSATNGKLYIGGKGSTPINVDLLMAKATGVSADPRVRQALSLAIDRTAIAKTIYNGAADPLYLVSGPGLWGYSKATYQAAYSKYVKTNPDIDAATKLVKAANASGKTIVFGYPAGDPQSVQLATVVQQEAAQIGLKVKLVGLPNQQYGSLFSDANARKPYDMFITKNYLETPEPALMDQLYGTPNGTTNFSGYDNATVNQLIGQAEQTADPATRATLVVEAEEQLAKDLPSIPVVQPRAAAFVSDELTGASLTFSYVSSPWAASIGGK